MTVATRARIPVGTPFLLWHHLQSLIPVGVVGNIRACHARARGSIPRSGAPFYHFCGIPTGKVVLTVIPFPQPYPASRWPPPKAVMDPRKGVSEKNGTIQRRLAWPLRKDDTLKSRMYHFFPTNQHRWCLSHALHTGLTAAGTHLDGGVE